MRFATASILAVFAGCAGANGTLPGGTDVTSGMPLAACAKAACIYVTNLGYPSTSLASMVTVYSAGANGNVKPLLTISGSKTKLGQVAGIAVDANGAIYVASWDYFFGGKPRITVYAAGASGNVAPVQDISGVNTGLTEPLGIAVDGSKNIYAVNEVPASIDVYAAGSTGDVSPMQTISGANTQLNKPIGGFVTATGTLYVANYGSSAITRYRAGANGNVKPTLTISGSNTKLAFPNSIAVDASGNIYITNLGNGGSLTVYKVGSKGNVAPIADVSGDKTELNVPVGIAVDASDDIFTATNSGNSVLSFSAGSNGNVSPSQKISGSKTTLHDIQDLTIH